ncbi:hypothetical protein ACFIJ5_01065 [Haloimpatiens sp. FM7330]|uniref:hypothetical protein n=1 Tax=Haloimpatiens sp. FM7330 TaxID=3298610 RepID=UPI003642B1F6
MLCSYIYYNSIAPFIQYTSSDVSNTSDSIKSIDEKKRLKDIKNATDEYRLMENNDLINF